MLFCLNNKWPHAKSEVDTDVPFGWNVFDKSASYLFDAVVNKGWAFSAHHNVSPHQRLNTDTFVEANFLVADLDAGVHPHEAFYSDLEPTLVYTTPSHTESDPRCRALFELEAPIGRIEYESAQKGLFERFESEGIPADKSCWNAARIFFGAQYSGICYRRERTVDWHELQFFVSMSPAYQGMQRYSLLPSRLPEDTEGWYERVLEIMGEEGGVIRPHSSRHTALLFAATLMAQRGALEDTIRAVLNLCRVKMAIVNTNRDIPDREIESIIKYVQRSRVDRFGYV